MDMKLKQRVVVLCAVLLLLGLAKIFLLDGGEGSAASRRDLRAFRRVRPPDCLLPNQSTHTINMRLKLQARVLGTKRPRHW